MCHMPKIEVALSLPQPSLTQHVSSLMVALLKVSESERTNVARYLRTTEIRTLAIEIKFIMKTATLISSGSDSN
jgi:hypothetical protein